MVLLESMALSIVCGDYQGDLEAIANLLNAFEFGQGDKPGQRFVVHDGRIEPDPSSSSNH